MKKTTKVLFICLMASVFLSACSPEPCQPCIDEDPFPPVPDNELAWYYLADLETISLASEAVINEDKFLIQLLNLSDDSLRATLANGDYFIDAARPYVNTVIRLKRNRLIRQNAYRFWEETWPEGIPLEIRQRDDTENDEGEKIVSDREAFIITPEKVYLLWPFNIQNSLIRAEWERARSLFEPEVLRYDPAEHLLASSLFRIIDERIEEEDDNFENELRDCYAEFLEDQEADELNGCIKGRILESTDDDLPELPSFLRFSVQVDSPLVATLLRWSDDGGLDMLISPNPTNEDSEDVTGPIPQYPDGRLQP